MNKEEEVTRYRQLEKENGELKAYKDVNEDFKTAWEELKAENERLRFCLDTQRIDKTNQYIEKVNIERKNYKLKQTLQKIKVVPSEWYKNKDMNKNIYGIMTKGE